MIVAFVVSVLETKQDFYALKLKCSYRVMVYVLKLWWRYLIMYLKQNLMKKCVAEIQLPGKGIRLLSSTQRFGMAQHW
jgi:hypothetical protein